MAKLNYFVIPVVAFLVGFIGSKFTAVGINSGWYAALAKPAWTPPGYVIGIVWTVIYILTAIAALIAWNSPKCSKTVKWLFVANAILNVLWSFLFFTLYAIGSAAIECFVLWISVIALMYYLWDISKVASCLLVPYAGWVAFATFLNCLIFFMQKWC